MIADLDMVQGNMDVYGVDGVKIGRVEAVARDRDMVKVRTPEGEVIEPTGIRYLQVARIDAVGLPAGALYIPEDAILRIIIPDGVTVNCTKDECSERYSRRPNII